jgi:hypothetical protein
MLAKATRTIAGDHQITQWSDNKCSIGHAVV